MAVFQRTTDGLLQLRRKTITKADFDGAVLFLEKTVLDAEARKKLGLTVAKQFTAPLVSKKPTAPE